MLASRVCSWSIKQHLRTISISCSDFRFRVDLGGASDIRDDFLTRPFHNCVEAESMASKDALKRGCSDQKSRV